MGFFLHGCIPVTTEESRERALFALVYGAGFTAADVKQMTVGERMRQLRYLKEQKQLESDKIKAARDKAKAGRR